MVALLAEVVNDEVPATNGKSPGQPCKLNDLQRRAIAGMIESGPIPAVHGVVRWRLIDLAQWIFEEFRITKRRASAYFISLPRSSSQACMLRIMA